MADEKKPGAAKELLMKHGEKIGLGVAAAALLAYLFIGVVMAKDDPSVQELEQQKRRVDREKSTRHKDMEAPDVKADTNVLDPWKTVTTAKSGGDAIARFMPEVKVTEVAKAKIPVKAALVPPIAIGATAVDFDGITVTWTVKEFTKQEMTKGAKENDYFKLTGFLIERETNGSGKWEKQTEVDAKTLTYKDTAIDPKTRYSYRITSIPEPDKEVKREEKAKGMSVLTASPVATKGIWKLSFSTPSKPAGSAKGMVYVKIEKYEKGRGTVDKSHIHYEGDKIGWWEEQAGGEPVSLHRISKDGKAFSVDFNTGFELVSVEPKRLMFDFKKCKKIYDKGNWVSCEQQVEKRPFSTTEIVYTDEEGKKTILVPAPQDANDLCENHGGKKIIVTLPDPKAPEQPKEDPKVVEARKRETEAAKLWADADKAEAAKNKSQAIALLKQLQEKYAETDFVSKQNKILIEERLAKLKQ